MAALVPGLTVLEFVEHVLGIALSVAQRTILAAYYALPMPDQEHAECFRVIAGYDYRPRPYPGGLVVVAGARGGKTERLLAAPLVYEALCADHSSYLSRGEAAAFPLVAQDARATRVAFGYIKAMLTETPELAPFVRDVRASEIDVGERVTISCFACTVGGTRGYTIGAAGLDEEAYWDVDGQEILRSVRRGMGTVPQPRLFVVSTPRARHGILWRAYESSWGKPEAKTLVIHAPTALLNPSFRLDRLAEEADLDERGAGRDYEARWLADEEVYVSPDVLAANVEPRRSLPPVPGVHYVGACDPSGGGGRERFAWCVAHREGPRVVVDHVGWRGGDGRAFSPQDAVAASAADFKAYGVPSLVGDRYAGLWVSQAFAEHRITYVFSARDKSGAFVECAPLFHRGAIALPDMPELLREFRQLEQRALPGGKVRVEHPRNGTDDLANAVALAAQEVAGVVPFDPKDIRSSGILRAAVEMGDRFANSGITVNPRYGRSDMIRHAKDLDRVSRSQGPRKYRGF